MIDRSRKEKDGKVLQSLLDIFMPRLNSGLLKDALIYLPYWQEQKKLSWPCEIWAVYDDNGARDVGWLYGKLMSEIRNAGLRDEDVKLTLSTMMPNEDDEPRTSERSFMTGAIDIRILARQHPGRDSREKKYS